MCVGGGDPTHLPTCATCGKPKQKQYLAECVRCKPGMIFYDDKGSVKRGEDCPNGISIVTRTWHEFHCTNPACKYLLLVKWMEGLTKEREG